MNVPAFLSYSLIAVFTPGPNNLMAMANSAKYGFRNALRFCIGVFCGFIVDMTLCAAATSLLYEYIPQVEPVMRWVGAAYILLLAWIVLRDRPGEEKDGGEQKKPRLSPCSVFTGTVMQLVNMKLILMGIMTFATFVLPHHQSFGVLALIVAGLAAAGFVSTCCWAAFGSLFHSMYRRHTKAVNAVMALLLVYCAVALFL